MVRLRLLQLSLLASGRRPGVKEGSEVSLVSVTPSWQSLPNPYPKGGRLMITVMWFKGIHVMQRKSDNSNPCMRYKKNVGTNHTSKNNWYFSNYLADEFSEGKYMHSWIFLNISFVLLIYVFYVKSYFLRSEWRRQAWRKCQVEEHAHTMAGTWRWKSVQVKPVITWATRWKNRTWW